MSSSILSDIKIRGEVARLVRVSLGLIKHAHTANVLNCFKNDRSSKFIGNESNFQKVRCVSRENQSLCKSRAISITYKRSNTIVFSS